MSSKTVIAGMDGLPNGAKAGHSYTILHADPESLSSRDQGFRIELNLWAWGTEMAGGV